MTRCLIALGGNLGPVEETFAAALRRLQEGNDLRVLRSSSIHRSAPVGERAGGEFLNAVAEIETDLPPLALLQRLQTIESDFGRTRDMRWGPRTLDLDLILYGDQVIDVPGMRVPHPACWYRRFVLDPLVEIAAETIHPEKQSSFATLRSHLLPRPLELGIAGGTSDTRHALLRGLQQTSSDVSCTEWREGAREPALLAWLGPADEAPTFEMLPLLPRLDASSAADPYTFLRDVLRAAGIAVA